MRRTASNAVRRVAPLNAALASDVGSVREENQDRVALVRFSDRNESPIILAVLADGIGGMKRGAECAALTLATFIDAMAYEAQHSVEPREWLRRSSQQANRAVHARMGGEGGSTLAAVLLTKGHRALWLSIGDTRVHQATEADLIQLSRDDTLEGQLGKPIEGERRSDLLQFVGIGDGLEPHIDAVPTDISGTLLLTTDGVHFITANYLRKVVHFAPDLGVCVRRLTDLAKMLGGPDNASVVAISVDALSTIPAPEVDSTYEVWDPFGELHVMFDRGHRYPSATSPPVSDGTTMDAGSQGASGYGVLPADGQSRHKGKPAGSAAKGKAGKPKARGGRKAKARNEKGEGAGSTEGEVPQLFIEFPHKTP